MLGAAPVEGRLFRPGDDRAGAPGTVVLSRAAIWNIDANQALGIPVTLDEYIGRTVRPRRLLTGIVALFAALALLLAACGVYGVVGFRAAQRKKEIAIRIALGAPRWRVTTVVMSDTVKSVALGLSAGVPLALTSAAAIRSQLFGVEPRDVVTLVTALTVIVLTALVAAYLPARRARQVDPIASLRVE